MALQSLLAPLHLADFENVDSFRNLSPFEMLLKATERDSQILEQEGAEAAVAGISKQEQNASQMFKLFGREIMISSPKTEETRVEDGVLVPAKKSDYKGKSVIVDDGEDDQSQRTKKTSGSKRKYVALSDGDDEEWVCEKRKLCKKSRKNFWKGSCSGTKITQNPEPTELPERFKNIISAMGGTEITLLFQKTLFTSDINKGHVWLLMPLQQMKTRNFL